MSTSADGRSVSCIYSFIVCCYSLKYNGIPSALPSCLFPVLARTFRHQFVARIRRRACNQSHPARCTPMAFVLRRFSARLPLVRCTRARVKLSKWIAFSSTHTSCHTSHCTATSTPTVSLSTAWHCLSIHSICGGGELCVCRSSAHSSCCASLSTHSIVSVSMYWLSCAGII